MAGWWLNLEEAKVRGCMGVMGTAFERSVCL